MTHPPGNSAAGIMQGLSQLIQGIGGFRDPEQERRQRLAALLQQNPQLRDQYIEQYAGNPDAINSLLGQKPRWGSSSDYDQLRNTLTGPLSSDAQAKQAQNKATIAEAENKEQMATTLNPTLKRGAAFEDFVNYGTGGQTIPAPTEQTPGVENISVQKGPGIAADDYARYQEAISAGGIRTSDQRAADKSKLAQQNALTAQAQAQLPVVQTKAKSDALALAKRSEDEATTTNVLKRIDSLPGKPNVYQAAKKGQISQSEMDALRSTDRGDRAFKDGMDDFYRNEQLKIEQAKFEEDKKRTTQMHEDMVNRKTESYRLWLRERMPGVNSDEIDRMIQDPEGLLSSTNPEDKVAQDEFKEFRDTQKKSGAIAKATAQFSGAYKSKVAQMKGREPNEQDINDLNNESRIAFAGSGYQPFVLGLKPTDRKKGLPFLKHNVMEIGYVSADPKLENELQGIPKIESVAGKAGDVTLPNDSTAKATLPPLTAADLAKAKIDKGFAGYLKSRGYKIE